MSTIIGPNPCPRCGKERVAERSWSEDSGPEERKSTVIYTKTVCPDPDCQAQVEKALAKEAERRQARVDQKNAQVIAAKKGWATTQ